MSSHTLADDLLIGVAKIAEYIGETPNQVYHQHKTKALPTFKLGAMICARKSQLDMRLSAEYPRNVGSQKFDW